MSSIKTTTVSKEDQVNFQKLELNRMILSDLAKCLYL